MSTYSFPFVVFILSVVALFNENCISKKRLAARYINNDSTAVFSTHPSRPFKYGYAYTREECEPFRESLNNYGIKNGQTIADVGAASGWLEGVFSTMVDSVTFFVQDIDTNILNYNQLNKVIQHFNSVRSTPQTNVFQLVKGSTKRTRLTDGIFDKIIIHNSFHEFKNPGRMIQDLRSKLKPEGQVIVYDKMSNSYTNTRHQGCGIRAHKADWVVSAFSNYGFYLSNMAAPINSFSNYLTFELNPQKSVAYQLKREKIESYVQELDRLNLKSINTDSIATIQIAMGLKPHVNEMLYVYPSMESYLNSLGYVLLNKKKTEEAVNVFRANTILFPQSSNAFDSLAEAYFQGQDFKQSLVNYQLSLVINPGNKRAIDKIKALEARMVK